MMRMIVLLLSMTRGQVGRRLDTLLVLLHLCQGLVNITVNCCIWNELMFKKDSVISANAFRCEVVVCEEKVESEDENAAQMTVLLAEEWSWC